MTELAHTRQLLRRVAQEIQAWADEEYGAGVVVVTSGPTAEE